MGKPLEAYSWEAVALDVNGRTEMSATVSTKKIFLVIFSATCNRKIERWVVIFALEITIFCVCDEYSGIYDELLSTAWPGTFLWIVTELLMILPLFSIVR